MRVRKVRTTKKRRPCSQMTKELTFRTSRRWPGRDCFGLGVEASPAQCTNLPSLCSPLLSRRWIWFLFGISCCNPHSCDPTRVLI